MEVHCARAAIKILVVVKTVPQSLNLMLDHLRVYVEILIKLHVHTMPTLNN